MKISERAPIKVGVLGLGAVAKNIHLPLLEYLKQFEVASVLSNKSTKQINELVGEVSIYTDLQSFAESKEYDLAIVLTPNHLHYEHVECLLNAGKNVVVDKPFVTSCKEASALQEIARKNNCLLSIFHNRRWDGDFLTIKNLLRDNTLGDVRYFESRFDKYRPTLANRWREQDLPGAGLLFDIGSHLIDQALELFGLPSSVYASISRVRKGAVVPDFYNITLYYGDKEVVLKTSSLAAKSPFRFYIEGDNGSFMKSSLDPQESALTNNTQVDEKDWIREPEEKYGTLFFEDHEQPLQTVVGDYRLYYQNIFDVICNSAELEVSAMQAAQVIGIIEASMESNERNCRITIDFDETFCEDRLGV